MDNKRIVLLHGWGANAAKLMPLKDELVRSGWKVLLPKLPGFDAPDPDRPWSLGDYSSFIRSKTKTEWGSDKYYIFGHSFGGRIAIKSAVQNNDKLLGIILCATGGISRGTLLKRIFFIILSKLGMILYIFPPSVRIAKKILYKFVGEKDYEKSNRVMKKTMQKVINEDLKPLLSDIKLDTLILWGKLDKTTPYIDARILKDRLQNAELVSFPKQGHKLPYILPEEIANEINKWIIQ